MLYVSNIVDEDTIEVSDSRTLKTTIVNANKLRAEGTKVYGLTQSRVVAYRDVEDFLTRYALRQRLVNPDYAYTFEYADKEVRVSGIDIYTMGTVDLEIPDFVDTLGNYAFLDKSNIRSVYIPDSVVRLCAWCFCKCGRLESVRLPQSLTYLDEYTFFECKALTNIDLSNGITGLGTGCFFGCTSLTNIVLPEGLTKLDKCCFSGCEALTAIVLPRGITELGISCFFMCTSLKSVVLPESIAELDVSCFFGCIALTNIVFPKGTVGNSISDIKTFIRCFKKGVPSIKTIEIDKVQGVSLSTIAEELCIEIRLLEE